MSIFEPEQNASFPQEAVEKALSQPHAASNLALLVVEDESDWQFGSEDPGSEETVELKTKVGTVRVGASMDPQVKAEFKKFMDSYTGNCFDSTTMGSTPFKATVKLKEGLDEADIPPVRYIPLSPEYSVEMNKMLGRMIARKILQKSHKKANCSLFLVEKSDGTLRLVADLKGLNRVIEDHVTHLPGIDLVLQKLATFSIYSYLDFMDAYFTVPIDKKRSSIDIVASIAGLIYNMEFQKLPQGLKTASSIFIDGLNTLYKKLLHFVVIYMDDLGIGADSDRQMFDRIREVLVSTEATS